MSDFSLQIFKSITSNPEYNYYEIKINKLTNCINIILSNGIDNQKTKIDINLIDVKELLNGLLPDKLKKLTIDGSRYTKISQFSNLPSKLKKLKLISFNSKLDNLPIELKVLELHGNCSECCLDYLPSSLITLFIQSNIKTSLDNLPSTLVNLFLLSEFTDDLKNLPIGLKFLHINSMSRIKVVLPKHIECIMYPENNNYLRRTLLKIYPKILHNEYSYKKSIDLYNDFEFDNHFEFNNSINNYCNGSEEDELL